METLKELAQLSQHFYENLSIAVYEATGIDLIRISHSPILKVIIAMYCLSLFILIVQKVRKKCYFDRNLSELGVLTSYILWGACCPVFFFQCVSQGMAKSVLVIGGILLLLIMIWIWHEPIKFIFENVHSYGFMGIIYSFALLGLGIFGLVCLLFQFIIAILPMTLIFVIYIFAVTWESDTNIAKNNYEDDDIL